MYAVFHIIGSYQYFYQYLITLNNGDVLIMQKKYHIADVGNQHCVEESPAG